MIVFDPSETTRYIHQRLFLVRNFQGRDETRTFYETDMPAIEAPEFSTQQTLLLPVCHDSWDSYLVQI
jgi:hypothetical protein